MFSLKNAINNPDVYSCWSVKSFLVDQSMAYILYRPFEEKLRLCDVCISHPSVKEYLKGLYLHSLEQDKPDDVSSQDESDVGGDDTCSSDSDCEVRHTRSHASPMFKGSAYREAIRLFRQAGLGTPDNTTYYVKKRKI